MNVKYEINALQKRLLARLNVKTGSTLYVIIQEVSRQAYAKQSFVVSQKNSTLAEKCGVTASTISRNLKKIKEKCVDLLTIEQNRNTGEQFAALIFTFVSQTQGCGVLPQPTEHQTETSNGEQTEQVNSGTEPVEVAENTSNSFSTYPLVQSFKSNKDLNTSIVNNKDVDKEKIINDAYKKFKQQGIGKRLFKRVLLEIKNKKGIRNFKAYLEGALSKVANHLQCNNGTKVIEHRGLNDFYGVLMGQ
ncbi:hypothetical protein POL82_04200 [Priestia aryabhattai]|uniref:hypothetical protein n=1 Tax=Priestia TaxID=2800373 RepID=UPI00234E88DE|nr:MULTISPECIES: hypothetical protein [Priestia]MDC7762650.1 hypothetical protein [Priestia aryabhattai]MED3980894.1 hypothetical protein [Priestia megaterium]